MLPRNLAMRFFRAVPFLRASSFCSHHFFLVVPRLSLHVSKNVSSSSTAHFLEIDPPLLTLEGKALPDQNLSREVGIVPFGQPQPQTVGVNGHEEDNVAVDLEVKLRELMITCITAPSSNLFEKLIASTTKLYNLSSTRHWSLHSRALANYGVQCFVDQKVSQAVELLRKAVEIIGFYEGETAVIHLRVIFANALTSEGECFAALCEYEKALEVMRDYPVETSLLQAVSGKEFHIPLCRSYVLEDFDRFLADEKVVQCALEQGRKRLHCSFDSAEKVRLTCTMARLQRRIGEKDASLLLYTTALRTLLDSVSDVDLEIKVMHDIGLLLCFEAFDVTQGLPYLQTASEMSFNFVLRELEKSQRLHGTQTQKASPLFFPLSEGTLRIRRAAFTLLDTAVCLAENDELGKALGLFEGCISLLDKCGMENHSAWTRMRYADSLASASLVDKAISVYFEAIRIIQSLGHDNDNVQMACMGMVVPLTIAEIEGRLAHCFQVHVGEYRRACVHFWQAIRRCGIELNSPFKISEKMATVTCEEVDSETVCWMLENYASCCERVGNLDIAEEALKRRIDVEKALGGSCSSALLRLAQLHEINNVIKAVEVYVQLLRLSDDAIEPDVLLQAAYGFANVCYASKDEELAAALSNASSSLSLVANRGEAEFSTSTLIDDSAVVSPNAIVVESFKRAASVIMASHAVDVVRSTGGGDDVELKALTTLSRGGFFCQRCGDETGAEELYRLAVEYTLLARVSSEQYSRELAIMFANYATVIAHKDVQKAHELYNKAVVTCPTEENVLTAAVSFFVLRSNYADGRRCVQHAIDAANDPSALPRLYGKLAWLGVVCWDELTPALRLECLQHLLLALDFVPNQDCLTVVTTNPSVNCLEEKFVTDDLKRRIFCGISTSQDHETVSLATYVAQTKLPHDGKFINACYKAALVRFSHNVTMLVNYAKFCADYGVVTLARKYYAAAFCCSANDIRTSECYADYLAFLKKEGQQEQQVVVGESLARYAVERSLHGSNAVSQAQAFGLYGKYLATFLPSPAAPVVCFETAIRRNPTDVRTMALYGSFLWNVCARSHGAKHIPTARGQVAAKVEDVYVSGLRHQPQSVALLTALGALYVDLADRFYDAVRVLERARRLSPRNAAVIRLLCTAFHEESIKEQRRVSAGVSDVRLRLLLETTRQLYEATLQLEPQDSLVLAKYCQFALHGLRNEQLASELMRRLQELQRME